MPLPVAGVLEFMLGTSSSIPLSLYCDASAARGALKAGYSKQMRHLGKTMGVSIAFLKHVIDSNGLKVHAIMSEKNSSDLHTKPLPRTTFEGHKATMGIRQAKL
jgi:hypothetical protein